MRADQTCRGSESGPGRLKARCGRTSHTVDSESGPGGLKARCGRTNHTVDSVYMARLGGWTRWTVGPVRRTSHTVDPKCMAVLCSVMIWHVMRVWYMWLVFWGYLTKLSGLQLWFKCFRYFRRPWQGKGVIVPLLMFMFYDMVLGIL